MSTSFNRTLLIPVRCTNKDGSALRSMTISCPFPSSFSFSFLSLLNSVDDRKDSVDVFKMEMVGRRIARSAVEVGGLMRAAVVAVEKQRECLRPREYLDNISLNVPWVKKLKYKRMFSCMCFCCVEEKNNLFCNVCKYFFHLFFCVIYSNQKMKWYIYLHLSQL